MATVNWFDRKFDFSGNQNIMPGLIERLEGTPVRLREKLKKISSSIYKIQPDNKWSILEHIGHLGDLEPLWQGRLEDILNGKKELRPTDLQNTQTTIALHNEQDPSFLIERFEQLRKATVESIKLLTEEEIFRSALHPRLKTPMRTMDHFLFVAEHDDHHLVKITEIANSTKA